MVCIFLGMTKTQPLKALVISPDQTVELVEIPRDSGELRALQGYIGGHIEAVYGWSTAKARATHADITFFCHEEGKILNQAVNELATALWWGYAKDARGYDHLRGVVVVAGGADGHGDTLSVPDQVIEAVRLAGHI